MCVLAKDVHASIPSSESSFLILPPRAVLKLRGRFDCYRKLFDNCDWPKLPGQEGLGFEFYDLDFAYEAKRPNVNSVAPPRFRI